MPAATKKATTKVQDIPVKATKKAKAQPIVEETEEEEDEDMAELTPAQRRRLAKRIAEDEKPVKATKKGKKAKKARIVSSRNANPAYRTRDVLGDEFGGAPDTLESSVGRQALHCLTVAGQKKHIAFKLATKLFETGTLAESKVRELRDVIREYMPDDDDEQEVVMSRRCCRGLGMVIARQNSEGDDE